MRFRVDQIYEKPVTLRADETVETFPVLLDMQTRGDCKFSAPIGYHLTVTREFDHLRVTGNITTSVMLSCSRCLKEYLQTIDTGLTIIFRRGEAGESEAMEEETELSEQDLISSVFYGDEIDLSHEIEEQIALEIPFRPLCGDDCKGLCAECGADMNQNPCLCSKQQFNFKFSALKDFKIIK